MPGLVAVEVLPLARSKQRVVLLASLGWQARDMADLCDDWSGANDQSLFYLADRAAALSQAGATPAQARRWLKSLYTLTSAGTDFEVTDQAYDWYLKHRNDQAVIDNGTFALILSFVDAAGGDHDLAALAFRAGLDEDELRALRAAGPVDRDALEVLGGLVAIGQARAGVVR